MMSPVKRRILLDEKRKKEIMKKLDTLVFPLIKSGEVDPGLVEGFRQETRQILDRDWEGIKKSLKAVINDYSASDNVSLANEEKIFMGTYIILAKELRDLPGGEDIYKKILKLAKKYGELDMVHKKYGVNWGG